jgi:hypothetical protein
MNAVGGGKKFGDQIETVQRISKSQQFRKTDSR